MNENAKMKIFAFCKKNALPAVMCLFGIVLLIWSGVDTPDTKAETDDIYKAADMAAYTEELEDRVKNIISEVDGVSDVTVLLTLDGGSEFVYAENRSGNVVDYLIINNGDGEEPVLVREIYAAVRGIAVVCGGGDDAGIQRTVSELLSCAFDIPSSKISVAGTGG